LQAIEEHTALGSGFHLAMRDMEIRGAGNLLGPQQHGFIEEIGFDLYCRLLDEAIAEARGTISESAPLTPVEIEVGGDRFLPDDYVLDNQQRFEMYKRLAELADPEAVDSLADEMADRFGPPPLEAGRLLDLARARVWARRGKVARAVASGNLWTTVFRVEAQIGRREIEEWRQAIAGTVTFIPGPPFMLRVRVEVGASADLSGLIELLKTIAAVWDREAGRSRRVPG
jgi:transcription-repair coupling factor (superfamily II helicase)